MNKNDKKKNDERENLREELIDEANREELEIEADEEIEELETSEQRSEEDKLEEEIKKLDFQLKRAVADYQNLEKRMIEQRSNWILSANKDLILRLLPGLDNLDLALTHTNDEGVKISIKHFMEILESEGVKKIKTVGESFDPNLMEAVTTSEGEEGKVVEEIKAGYTLNGNVLRVAQVIVGSENKN